MVGSLFTCSTASSKALTDTASSPLVENMAPEITDDEDKKLHII